MKKLNEYSTTKRREISDILSAMGLYYGRNISEQITLWAADLIDLEVEDLAAAVIKYHKTDLTNKMPGPGQLRNLAMREAVRRTTAQKKDVKETEFTPEEMKLNAERLRYLIENVGKGKWTRPIDCHWVVAPKCRICLDTGIVFAFKGKASLKFKCDCGASSKVVGTMPNFPKGIELDDSITIQTWGDLNKDPQFV